MIAQDGELTPVAMALRFAQGLWPHDPAAGSEAVLLAWTRALAPYPIEELYPALEGLAMSSPRMPSLAVLLDELRERRRKAGLAARPLLDPPAPAQLDVMATPEGRAESQARADEYRETLIRQQIRMESGPRQDTPVSEQRRAEIRRWAYEVGPIDAAYLAKHGVEVAVTRPQRGGGNVAEKGASPADLLGNLSPARSTLSNSSPRPIAPAAFKATTEPAGMPGVPPADYRSPEEWADAFLSASAGPERDAVAADIRSLPDELRDDVRAVVQRQREGVG